MVMIDEERERYFQIAKKIFFIAVAVFLAALFFHAIMTVGKLFQ